MAISYQSSIGPFAQGIWWSPSSTCSRKPPCPLCSIGPPRPLPTWVCTAVPTWVFWAALSSRPTSRGYCNWTFSNGLLSRQSLSHPSLLQSIRISKDHNCRAGFRGEGHIRRGQRSISTKECSWPRAHRYPGRHRDDHGAYSRGREILHEGKRTVIDNIIVRYEN